MADNIFEANQLICYTVNNILPPFWSLLLISQYGHFFQNYFLFWIFTFVEEWMMIQEAGKEKNFSFSDVDVCRAIDICIWLYSMLQKTWELKDDLKIFLIFYIQWIIDLLKFQIGHKLWTKLVHNNPEAEVQRSFAPSA